MAGSIQLRKPVIAVFIAFTGIVAAAVTYRPDHLIRAATGLTSHALCSAVFISGLDPAEAYDENVKTRPGVGLLSPGIRYEVDRARREVNSTFSGTFRSRVVYDPELGCVLGPVRENHSGLRPALPRADNSPLVESSDPRMRAALDRAFAERDRPPWRRVKAVVVMHNGEIVAERYAAGYGPGTIAHGWSLTKTVMNALLGVLVRQGKLSVEQKAPVLAWRGDSRQAITIGQLLRMSSGLAFNKLGGGSAPGLRLLYTEPDMAGFAETAQLKAAPGARWEYETASTVILARVIRDAVGGRAADVLDFARRELFDPLGIHTMRLEFDGTGTPAGGTFGYASARDWGRLGTLYLNDGVAGGRRILPEGWVRYSSSPTLGRGYGAGLWTTIGQAERWGMPPGTFYADGIMGQFVVIVPAERLVVVRLASTWLPDLDIGEMGKLVASAATALH